MKAEIKKSVKAAIKKREYGVSSSDDSEWWCCTPVTSSTNNKFGRSRKHKFSNSLFVECKKTKSTYLTSTLLATVVPKYLNSVNLANKKIKVNQIT